MESSRYVEQIFARLLVRYGAAWNRMWDGVDPAAVKADWAAQLEGASGYAIRYALDNLPPDRPPTVTQFKALMLNRPDRQVAQLPAPPANPERVRRELERMRNFTNTRRATDWAYALQEREKAGEPLTEAERGMWRKAIEAVPEATVMGHFKGIDPDCLPPGMR